MGCDFTAFCEASLGVFQSTHPVWDATFSVRSPSWRVLAFQSTHPVWDATWTMSYSTPPRRYFNPRIPYGMRPRIGCRGLPPGYFNPRIPYGMRRAGFGADGAVLSISIHASRMGCDAAARMRGCEPCNFNPRIPYGMRRFRPPFAGCRQGFQSTHPVWDATLIFMSLCRKRISIHASRMGCDPRTLASWPSSSISIHASRMGCDHSTAIDRSGRAISIHASRMGCDSRSRSWR